MDALKDAGHRQAVRPGHADDRSRGLHQELVRANARARRKRDSLALRRRSATKSASSKPRLRQGGGAEQGRPAARAGKARPRASASTRLLRSRLALPRDRPARRVRPLRRAGARRRRHHRRRHGRGTRGRRRRERRHGEGRVVVARDDHQDAARAGDRDALPHPDHLPRRLGGREPAVPGRRLPRPVRREPRSSTTTRSCAGTCTCRRSPP